MGLNPRQKRHKVLVRHLLNLHVIMNLKESSLLLNDGKNIVIIRQVHPDQEKSKTVMENTNEDEITKRKEECQNYHYKQSSKVSQLIRNIIYAIIGTIWVMIYKDPGVQSPGAMLTLTLGSCLLYLLVDLIHYFADACSYRVETFRLDRDCNREGILFRHEEYMDRVSKRSFIMLCVKFGLIILIAVIFVWGILAQLGFIGSAQ